MTGSFTAFLGLVGYDNVALTGLICFLVGVGLYRQFREPPHPLRGFEVLPGILLGGAGLIVMIGASYLSFHTFTP